MRGAMGAVVALALAVPVLAQEAGGYAAGENPFQAEYAFAAGQAITLKVAVDGVNLDTLTLAPEPASGDSVSCPVTLVGSNQGAGKVTVTAVVLLEDAKGKAVERLTMSQFRVKSGRQFSRRESITVQSASIAAAAKVYLFVKVE